MLKILQVRLQQYVNWELPDVQAGFRKSRWTRDQIANICWIIEKAREFPKNTYFRYIDYAEAFDCVDHNKLWNILRDGDTRPPYLRPVMQDKKQVRIGHGTVDWFITGKGCILSPCLFKFYAECIMRNAGLYDSQAGIKIVWRNINSLRHATDTILMTESE